MSKLIPFSVLAAVCLPISASSQSSRALSPRIVASSGTNGNTIPYSWSPIRYQQIYDYDTFIGSVTVPVKSVNYRMHKRYANGTRGGQSITLSMWMAYTPQGATPITSQNASMTFDKNIDKKTLLQVVNRKKLVLPKLKNTSFGFKVPTSSPFIFSSGFKRSLVIETRVYSNSNGNKNFYYPLDNYHRNSVGAGSYTVNGSYRGCKSKSGTLVSHYAVTTWLKVGSTLSYSYGFGRAASLPALMSLGAQNLNLTLPGTSCRIVNDMVVIFPGVTRSSSSGYYRVPLPIPNDPKLANVVFKTQMFFFEKAANSLGVTSTSGLNQKIGAGNPWTGGSIRTLYAADSRIPGYNPDRATVATGSARDYGLVTEITN